MNMFFFNFMYYFSFSKSVISFVRLCRYARWSLGFVNPPLEVAGTGQKCTIRALNERGNILLPAVIEAMNKLLSDNILEDVQISDGQVDVKVVPPAEVGSFSEEERSRQVCKNIFF